MRGSVRKLQTFTSVIDRWRAVQLTARHKRCASLENSLIAPNCLYCLQGLQRQKKRKKGTEGILLAHMLEIPSRFDHVP